MSKKQSDIQEARNTLRARPGEAVDFMLIQIVCRVICALPCLFLFTDHLKYLALISPVLFVFLLLPMRQNAAGCMQKALNGGSLFSMDLIGTEGYWKKLLQGLISAGYLFLWALPFLTTTVYVVRVIFGNTVVGQTDVISVLLFISRLGGGDFVKGSSLAVVLYLCTLIPWIIGLGIHSGRRHAYALGNTRMLKGCHGRIFVSFLKGCLLLLPFFALVGYFGVGYFRNVVQALNMLGTGGLHLPKPGKEIYWLLVGFVVLVVPLIPLKSMITASTVHRIKEEKNAA